LLFALGDESPSDYPYIFRYSFSGENNDFNKILKLSAAIHLLQASTFVIDDILDSSKKRYHLSTVQHKYGIKYAIILGELLQLVASKVIISEISQFKSPNQSKLNYNFNELILNVYIGQYFDLCYSGSYDITMKEYLDMIGKTTGSFLSILAECGAMLGNRDKNEVQCLAKFGYHYGIALQICDDIFDLTLKKGISGKDLGQDIKNRRMRLPYIFALEYAYKKLEKKLRKLSKDERGIKKNYKKIIKCIKDVGSLKECEKIVQEYVNKSISYLSTLSCKQTRNKLKMLSLSLLEDLK
jgi:geranylgeranyl pyrophosphate synthase